MPSKILPCTCEHISQDKIYGKGRRLHNYSDKKDIWRCSVCNKERMAEKPTVNKK